MSSIFLAYRSHMTIHDSHMTSAATPPSIARRIIGVSFFPLDPIRPLTDKKMQDLFVQVDHWPDFFRSD